MRFGIDIGGTKIEGAALGADGAVRARERIATPRDDYPGTIDAIGALLSRLEATTGAAAERVGVAIPGTVSPATGQVKNANSTWLIGRPFDRDLAAALARPVRVANDANCFAVSEAVDGAGAGFESVFGVILGTGVGGGIALGGRPRVGRNAIAGEWGHNPLPWPRDDERPGRPCYCGKRGCIETFLSGPGLAADYEEQAGRALTPAAIADLAATGDAAANAALERYVDRLARGLATVINVLDPDVIVLGGGLSALDRLYDAVPRRWLDYVFSDRVDTVLRPPVHGDSSGVRGAAWLWPAGDA